MFVADISILECTLHMALPFEIENFDKMAEVMGNKLLFAKR
jgi:hypothetical protein